MVTTLNAILSQLPTAVRIVLVDLLVIILSVSVILVTYALWRICHRKHHRQKIVLSVIGIVTFCALTLSPSAPWAIALVGTSNVLALVYVVLTDSRRDDEPRGKDADESSNEDMPHPDDVATASSFTALDCHQGTPIPGTPNNKDIIHFTGDYTQECADRMHGEKSQRSTREL